MGIPNRDPSLKLLLSQILKKSIEFKIGIPIPYFHIRPLNLKFFSRFKKLPYKKNVTNMVSLYI